MQTIRLTSVAVPATSRSIHQQTLTSRFPRPALLLTLSAVLSCAGSLSAGTTWTANGTDSNINNADNWGGTVNSLNGTTAATFGSAGSNATINVDAAFGNMTFTRPFSLEAGDGNLTVRGTNSGATANLQTNSGATTVTINETLYVRTVPTAAPAGGLLVINVNRPTDGATALFLNNGIARDASSTGSATYELRFANGSGGLSNARIAGPISGMGNLVNAGSVWQGDLIIAGNQSLGTSSIAISSGGGFGNPTAAARIVLGESSADAQTWNNVTLNNVMNLAIGGNVTINSFGGSGAARVTGTGAAGATLWVSSGTIASNVTFGGNATGENSLNLVKQNAGTLTVNGTHTYNGTTTVNGGAFNLNGTLASALTVNSGASLAVSTTGNATASITINSGATLSGEGRTGGQLTFGAGGSNLIFDSSTEPGAFTADSISAAGASVLLTPSGATTINATYTVLKQVTGTFSGNASDSFIAATRGTLAFANANKDLTLTPTEAASLAWTGANGTNPTFWDVATTVNWTNGGSPDRFYANDAVTFDDSASSFAVAVQGSSVSPGNIVISNSASDYTFSGGGIAGPGSITKNGTGNATIGNALTNAGGIVVNAGTLTLNAVNNFGSGGVTLNAGALNLNAANSFTGNLTVNGGTLTATTGGLGTLALVRPIALSGGILNYTGTTLSSDVLAFAISGNNSLAAATAGQTLRSGGPLTGSGNLDISGPGIIAFGKNSVATLGSTYTGTLTVKSGGTLDIRNPDSMGATGPGSGTIVEAGGQLLINPFNQAAGVVFDAETISFQGSSGLVNWNQSTTAATTNTLTGAVSTGGTLTISSLSSGGAPTLAINATISGAGGVTFGGAGQAGTYVLNAANTFNGPTTVTSGTLVLSGAGTLATSAVAVNGNITASGTLAGSGSVGGPVTVNAFGQLRAGIDSLDVATLTLTGGLTTMADSLIEIGLGADASTHDVLALSGASSFQASQAFRFLDQGAAAGVTYTGLITGIDSGLNVAGWTVTNAGWTGVFTNNSGTLNFELTAIPEPATLALVAGGLAFLSVARRIRRP